MGKVACADCGGTDFIDTGHYSLRCANRECNWVISLDKDEFLFFQRLGRVISEARKRGNDFQSFCEVVDQHFRLLAAKHEFLVGYSQQKMGRRLMAESKRTAVDHRDD